eukprot:m.18386 g.18386  ORF g.18386 m.18386 type:complete len:621 (-) comp3588_c0_seq1:141-2003(-)
MDSTTIMCASATGQRLDKPLSAAVCSLLGSVKTPDAAASSSAASRSRRLAAWSEAGRQVWTSRDMCRQLVKTGHANSLTDAQEICRKLMTTGALVEQDRRHLAVSAFSHANTTHKWQLKVKQLGSSSESDAESASTPDTLGIMDDDAATSDAPAPLIRSPLRRYEKPGESLSPGMPFRDDQRSRSQQSSHSVSPRRQFTSMSADNPADLRMASLVMHELEDADQGNAATEGDTVSGMSGPTADGGGGGGASASESSHMHPRDYTELPRRDTTASLGFETADEMDEMSDTVPELHAMRRRRGGGGNLVAKWSRTTQESDTDTLMYTGVEDLLREEGHIKLLALFKALDQSIEQLVTVRAQTPGTSSGKSDKGQSAAQAQASDAINTIMDDARDTIEGINSVLQELYAHDFLDAEMQEQLDAAEEVQARIEADIPDLRDIIDAKQKSIQTGEDKDNVRAIWNAKYVNKIQKLETRQKFLKDSVWNLLRDGRDHIQIMQDHSLFIESMVDEAQVVKEKINEKRNWLVPVIHKFKLMAMRLLDRSATANVFRTRALYLMMLRVLEARCGKSFVERYKYVTYVPIVFLVFFVMYLIVSILMFFGFKRTFFFMVCYTVYEYFIVLG